MVAGILSEYMVEWILFTCAISELGRTGGGGSGLAHQNTYLAELTKQTILTNSITVSSISIGVGKPQIQVLASPLPAG